MVDKLPSPRAYAYGILDALMSGRFEDGFRVSFLVGSARGKEKGRIREALRILERNGHIKIENPGPGRPPARIYLQGGSRGD